MKGWAQYEKRLFWLLVSGVLCNLLCISYMAFKMERGLDQDYLRSNAIFPATRPFNVIPTTSIWLAGIISDGSQINSIVWDAILELNCYHNIGIHIITKENAEEALHLYSIKVKAKAKNKQCAPMKIQNQTVFSKRYLEIIRTSKRIDRISAIRDAHRELLREEFVYSEGIVVLADLDLKMLPKTSIVMDQILKVKGNGPVMGRNDEYEHDAICANGSGISKPKKGEIVGKYYDTFATVFWPDTFALPLKMRASNVLYEGENPKLVRSDDAKHGKFTQQHIFKYFKNEGIKTNTGNVRVTSCFGDLAIYKSKLYFEDKCNYQLNNGVATGIERSKIMRYESKKERRPCEHVVFHDCLINNVDGFNIAVNPNMITYWKRNG